MVRAKAERGPEKAEHSPECVIEGARTHNLKSLTCRIPFGRLTVITGVSGSGKSSLAFDTLYAEGQRRFVDCLSTYARQFLQRLDRPDVDRIGEIQPPVAVTQQNLIRNARSTVSTLTEIGDRLQLIFAHAATPFCPACGSEMRSVSLEDAVDFLQALDPEARWILTAPVELAPDAVAEESGPSAGIADSLIRQGHSRVYRDGKVMDWSPPYAAGSAGVVIDRFTSRTLRRPRAAESVESAWLLGHGDAALFRDGETVEAFRLRRGLSCPSCGRRGDLPKPHLFSPNSPLGACETCQGFGRIITLDRDRAVPNRSLSLKEHAVVPFSTARGAEIHRLCLRTARRAKIPIDVPFHRLTPEQQEWVFKGDSDYPGVEGFFRWLERKRYKVHVRIFLARFRGYVPCPDCGGSRRKAQALSFRLESAIDPREPDGGPARSELPGGSARIELPGEPARIEPPSGPATIEPPGGPITGSMTIHDLESLPIAQAREFLERLDLPSSRRARIAPVLEETISRLRCLEEAGVGYLSLTRAARTLSGGEIQRIRLAAALGSGLTDTLYVLDEPTGGLHAADTDRIIGILRRLCATGNTLVVVEHDPQVIEKADHLIVLGPSGGQDGGELVYQGPVGPFFRAEPGFFRALGPAQASREGASVMRAEPAAGAGASGSRGQPRAGREQGGRGLEGSRSLTLHGIRQHNLDIPRLEIPLDRLTVITGISGSGKSTLVDDVLYRNLLRLKGRPVEEVGRLDSLEGADRISEVLLVAQHPLGRSTRSNVVTFVGLYGAIRALLARTPQAKARSLGPGAFSFNVPGGRCEVCQGMGSVTLEMHFMADVEVTCEACRGRRFEAQVCEVTWRGKNVVQMLELTVREALSFFSELPGAEECLAPLVAVGLDYLRLGQSTATLSGGEAQRLRIASFLAEGQTRRKGGRRGVRPTAGRSAQSDRRGLRGPGRDGEPAPAVPARKLFLFDEPTSGLHPRDILRLLAALRRLIDLGHGVAVVEHQLDFIRSADHLIDLGPGAGDEGGRLVYAGPVEGIARVKDSVTGKVLSRR